ncbi:MAG: DMT family transporter, partial [Actinobacteria bacterium]
ALFFGTLAILTPLAYRYGATPLPLLTWRFVFASLLLAVVATAAKRGSLRVPLSDVGRFATLAVTGYGLASICFFFALIYADAAIVAVLLYTYPAIVTVVSWILGMQRPDWRKALAVAVTFLGCVLVMDPFHPGVTVKPMGILLGLGAAAGYSSFNLLSHRWLPGRSRLVMMTYTFGIAAAFAGAICLLGGGSLSTAGWAPQVWWLLGAIVLMPTFGAILLYLEGIRGLGPAQAAVISTLEPLFTIALAAIVFPEQRLAPIQLVGAAIVLAGVVASELLNRTAEELPPV